jgi:hypothetical protein
MGKKAESPRERLEGRIMELKAAEINAKNEELRCRERAKKAAEHRAELEKMLAELKN